MGSTSIKKLMKEIPLEVRVRVCIESWFIVHNGGYLFMPLDENGDELPEAMEVNRKAIEKSKNLIEAVLDDIKEWKEDGCP